VKPLLPLAVVLLATPVAMGRPALLGRDPPRPSGGGQPHPAVVRVVVPEGGSMSLGSGTLVAVSEKLGLVVTNWHVVRDAKGQIVVVFPDGFRSGATVVRTDRDWDLAALAVWRPSVAPAPLATRPPQPGEPLTIAGYGTGRYRAITGRCTQYVAPARNQPFEMVELSAGARQGDSGGPIFNDRGELAGVLFGAAWGQTTGSYCGRVGQFLASATDDFRRLDASSTMIAQRPQGGVKPTGRQGRPAPSVTVRPLPPSAGTIAEQSRSDPIAVDREADQPRRSDRLPVVSIAAGRSRSKESGVSRPATAPPDTGWSGSAPQSHPEGELTGPLATEPLRWEDVAGSTRTEQLKTVLAAVGALAIFIQGLRLLSRTEAEKS
jgi:serine protease Do